MTRDERQSAARRLYSQLSRWLDQRMTPGLSAWSATTAYVSAPSDQFLDAVQQWVTTGAPEDWEALDDAYRNLGRVWTEADQHFRSSREPVTAGGAR